MLHRPRGAQGGRREQAPREQGPPPRTRRAFQRAGPPGESRPAFGTVGWGPSPPLPCADREAPPGPFCGSLPPDGIPMALAGGAGDGGSRSHHPLFSKKGEAEAPRGEEGSLRRHSSSHAWVPTALWRWPRAGTEREAGDRLPEGVSGAGASPERPFQDVAVEWLSPGEGGRKWLALLGAQ